MRMTTPRSFVGQVAVGVVVVALVLVSLVAGRALLHRRQTQLRRHAVAEYVGVEVGRIVARKNPEAFVLLTKPRSDVIAYLIAGESGEVFVVSYHLPFPENFSWHRTGEEGVCCLAVDQISRFFNEDAAGLQCDIVERTDKMVRFIFRGSDWDYRVTVSRELGIVTMQKSTSLPKDHRGRLSTSCRRGGCAKAMQEQCGADCSLGWYDLVNIFGTRIFNYHFWGQLCNEGNSVGGACLVAANWTYAQVPRTAWYNYSVFGATSGGAGVFPARFGNRDSQ